MSKQHLESKSQLTIWSSKKRIVWENVTHPNKINPFNAILVSPALWVYKLWTLSCHSKQQLESFQREQSLRRIQKNPVFEVA